MGCQGKLSLKMPPKLRVLHIERGLFALFQWFRVTVKLGVVLPHPPAEIFRAIFRHF